MGEQKIRDVGKLMVRLQRIIEALTEQGVLVECAIRMEIDGKKAEDVAE